MIIDPKYYHQQSVKTALICLIVELSIPQDFLFDDLL